MRSTFPLLLLLFKSVLSSEKFLLFAVSCTRLWNNILWWDTSTMNGSQRAIQLPTCAAATRLSAPAPPHAKGTRYAHFINLTLTLTFREPTVNCTGFRSHSQHFLPVYLSFDVVWKNQLICTRKRAQHTLGHVTVAQMRQLCIFVTLRLCISRKKDK